MTSVIYRMIEAKSDAESSREKIFLPMKFGQVASFGEHVKASCESSKQPKLCYVFISYNKPVPSHGTRSITPITPGYW